MPFDIESFKSNGLVFAGARPALFQVVLTFPNVGTAATGVGSGGSFLVQAASLPPGIIGEIDVFYFGRPIKVAGDRVFQNWNITVMNDEGFTLRNAFENWQNAINTLISNELNPAVAGPISSQTTYKTDLIVQQYFKDGPASESGIARDYKIVGAFPTLVSPIPLAWEATNRYETFDVTLAYDYWIPGPNTPAPVYNPEIA